MPAVFSYLSLVFIYAIYYKESSIPDDNLGDKLWGKYGFYDAFSETEDWFPKRYMAIDQGPIVVMIENHRSGLLWDLFMSNEDVQRGLDNLGFSY